MIKTVLIFLKIYTIIPYDEILLKTRCFLSLLNSSLEVSATIINKIKRDNNYKGYNITVIIHKHDNMMCLTILKKFKTIKMNTEIH